MSFLTLSVRASLLRHMSGSVNEAREAWQRASDAEVSRAICDLAEYPAGVRKLIEVEAVRRGITPDNPFPRSQLPELFLANLLRQGMRTSWKHWLMTSFSAGFLFSLCAERSLSEMVKRTPTAGFPFYILVGILVLRIYLSALLALPLRSYRRALSVSGSYSLGILIHQSWARSYQIRQIWLSLKGVARLPDPRRYLYAYSNSVGLLAPFLITSLILCAIVFVRNRYWPNYGPGRCTKCGYDLHALPSLRCPECGTRF